MSTSLSSTAAFPDDQLVARLLSLPESYTFDCKRIIGKVDKLLETVVAFANADGGMIALGFEDPSKATGSDRVYGLQENLLNWDELLRKLKSRITEPEQLRCTSQQIVCTLRDGAIGSIGWLRIGKSTRVHSIVDNGTYVRLQQGNKEITATEINDLSFARGTISAESQLAEVDFDLLKTDFWTSYADQRGITRPLDQALYTIGLARKNAQGELRPTMAAVLLFAEEPSGVLANKASIRLFHYRGQRASTDPNTNLAKPPVTIGGLLIQQIRDARQAVVQELGQRVQHTDLGFEIVQKYPLRVISPVPASIGKQWSQSCSTRTARRSGSKSSPALRSWERLGTLKCGVYWARKTRSPPPNSSRRGSNREC